MVGLTCDFFYIISGYRCLTTEIYRIPEIVVLELKFIKKRGFVKFSLFQNTTFNTTVGNAPQDQRLFSY